MKRSSLFSCLAAAAMFVLCALAPPTWHPVPTAPATVETNAYESAPSGTASVLRASPIGFSSRCRA